MTPTLLFVFGTRPEAIKLAPVILAARDQGRFHVKVCVTAQHRGLLDGVLAFFGITPDADLDLMRPNQTLGAITAGVLDGLAPVLAAIGPDWVVVQGDTTTAFVAGLAAFYARIPVAHVEAGLRTGKLDQPWPEELNRRLLAGLATVHFAPTAPARDNLLREGIAPTAIHVTGNTGIDALHLVRRRLDTDQDCRGQVAAALAQHGLDNFAQTGCDFVLVTAHRRESAGAGLDNICAALAELCKRFPGTGFVFPVHPNPAVQDAVARSLASARMPNLSLCPPLDYLPFVALMLGAALVLTDSGGVQEEAPSLGKPVVVMRDCTERTEGAISGLVYLAGAERARIVDTVTRLLRAPPCATHRPGNYYGDGQAAGRILAVLSRLSQAGAAGELGETGESDWVGGVSEAGEVCAVRAGAPGEAP